MGIEPEKIIKNLASFKNIKRRLEKKYDADVTVFDDIAHSPKKAEAVLRSIKKIYKCHPERSHDEVQDAVEGSPASLPRIFAVFEPNSGNRQPESIPGYDNVFVNADEVVIPKLTRIKRDPNKPEPIDGVKLAEIISKTHDKVKYIEEDEKLIEYLVNNTKTGDVIIFLGSHGFRRMIDELVKSLESPKS
jgi:UDP-N-acetylmuramate-alanine ligase